MVFFNAGKTWTLLTFFTNWLCSCESPILHCLFITPVFAYSTCRTSWVKLKLLSAPVRRGNFIAIFFELGALLLFSSCFFHFFFPFISFLFHIFCTPFFPSLPPFVWSSFLHPVKHRGSGPKIPYCGRCLSACWKCSITTSTQVA